jgi:YecR-like lipoprotein
MRILGVAGACFAVAITAYMAGCARSKELVATGGSRADGTFGALENPKLDFSQGVSKARDRCRAWGYTDAEPFGGETRQCNAPSQYGCMRWFVSMLGWKSTELNVFADRPVMSRNP